MRIIEKFRDLTKKEAVFFVFFVLFVVFTIILNCRILAWGTYTAKIETENYSLHVQFDANKYDLKVNGIKTETGYFDKSNGFVEFYSDEGISVLQKLKVCKSNAFVFTVEYVSNYEKAFNFFINWWAILRQAFYAIGGIITFFLLIPWMRGLKKIKNENEQ